MSMSMMLSRPKMEILVGPPGSGKTTYAQKYLPQYTYINQDKLGKLYKQAFGFAVSNGEDIVVDRMNFNKKQREFFIEAARANGYEIIIKVFAVPYDVCLERCLARTNHETIHDEKNAKEALHHFFTKFERPTDDEVEQEGAVVWFGHDPVYRWDGKQKEECTVYDLDGTLCDCSERQKYVQGPGKKDWKKFFENIANDTPHNWCVRLLKHMRFSGLSNLKTVLASGRPDTYRTITEEWLAQVINLPIKVLGIPLFMRRSGDFRRDDIVKEIILDFEILPRYNPLFFVDDRQQVVDMYRRRGFTVLQCAPGNF